MPEVTDLMRVAQWAKSSGAPSDVYNAACRMLDQPDEAERLRAERDALRLERDEWRDRAKHGDGERIAAEQRAHRAETEAQQWRALAEDETAEAERDVLQAAIERVTAFAAELRTYCSPAGIAAVYADSLETVINSAESHRDGPTPQTLGTGEGQEAGEAHGAAQ